jgi:plastocyanin
MRESGIVLGLLLTTVVAAAAQIPVSMIDFAFSPDSISISTGDEVVWTNNGSYIHTSTSGTNGNPDGTWNSGDVSPGGNYSRVFPTSGRFPYFCMHHYAIGMTGVVVVGTNGVDDSRIRPDNEADIRALPNPFRSAVTLESNAADGAGPFVRIYDVLGHLVASPAPVRRGGRYTANWDGRDDSRRVLPAGVYLCVSNSATVVLTKVD